MAFDFRTINSIYRPDQSVCGSDGHVYSVGKHDKRVDENPTIWLAFDRELSGMFSLIPYEQKAVNQNGIYVVLTKDCADIIAEIVVVPNDAKIKVSSITAHILLLGCGAQLDAGSLSVDMMQGGTVKPAGVMEFFPLKDTTAMRRLVDEVCRKVGGPNLFEQMALQTFFGIGNEYRQAFSATSKYEGTRKMIPMIIDALYGKLPFDPAAILQALPLVKFFPREKAGEFIVNEIQVPEEVRELVDLETMLDYVYECTDEACALIKDSLEKAKAKADTNAKDPNATKDNAELKERMNKLRSILNNVNMTAQTVQETGSSPAPDHQIDLGLDSTPAKGTVQTFPMPPVPPVPPVAHANTDDIEKKLDKLNVNQMQLVCSTFSLQKADTRADLISIIKKEFGNEAVVKLIEGLYSSKFSGK